MKKSKLAEFNRKYGDLARFNAERARGLMHYPEWIDKMVKLQAEYNREYPNG